MPKSAISTGCIDFVLSPEGIAQQIVLISTALAEIDRFPRYFNELRKFTTLPTMLMASTEMFSVPK
jgi:hypothetical protein